MQAVLMAGGRGTRLRPLTAVLPKPLVPIGDISILEMVLRQLRHYGFGEIVICVGYRAELIMAVVGDGSRFGVDVRYHVEEQPMGTIGALTEIDSLDESFLVLNGDICTNLDFTALLEFHMSHGELATIATYQRIEKIELGVLHLDSDGQKLVSFEEKPTYEFWVSMGVNAFRRDVTDLIPAGEFFGFDTLVRKMLVEQIDVKAFKFDGLWLDIGRPDDYERILEQFPEKRQEYLPDGA